jgi:hypothetical protein
MSYRQLAQVVALCTGLAFASVGWWQITGGIWKAIW